MLKKNSKTMPTDLPRRLDEFKKKFSVTGFDIFSWLVPDVKKEHSSHQSSQHVVFKTGYSGPQLLRNATAS